MTEMMRRLRLATSLVVAVFIIGVLGYHVVGGDRYGWLDAIYMTAITLTTVGYHEVIDVEHHPGGRVFTIVLLVFGTGSVVYFASVVTAFVVEGDITQQFRRRRMLREIDTLSNHYIVCGAGVTGLAVLRELVTTKHRVVLVDQADAVAQRVEREFPKVPTVLGDVTDDETLLRAGVERAEGIVVASGTDKDVLVAVVTARQLNPAIRIVARARDDHMVARLKQAGADGVVCPPLIGGLRLASEMVRPSVVTFLDTMLRDRDRNLRIEEVEVPRASPLAGRATGELDLRAAGNVMLLAVRDPDDGRYIYNPTPDYAVRPGAFLIVMGDPDGVRALRAAAASGRLVAD